MTKKFLKIACAAVLLFAGSARAEIDGAKAENFVKDVTAQGIEDIINANVSQAEKDARFAKLFNEALDLDFIGQFVLGRNWKVATPEQRKEFIKVYRQLNVSTWSKRFDEFKGKNFVFKGTSPSNSKGQIFVNSVVPMDQGEPAKVVWRVREKAGQYKIVDIIIENVSLAITARNEYTAFIKNNPGGIDALISNLKSKI
ncbi:MAG: ABC transporter substrate-binding protein [Alphaproteobacteria bacterium]|nr:ABC transporter substrate-binding protein [Alphaproteobacteria bacterium]